MIKFNDGKSKNWEEVTERVFIERLKEMKIPDTYLILKEDFILEVRFDNLEDERYLLHAFNATKMENYQDAETIVLPAVMRGYELTIVTFDLATFEKFEDIKCLCNRVKNSSERQKASTKYFVQIEHDNGEISLAIMADGEIISRADMMDCSGERFAIWKVSGLGKLEPILLRGKWHNLDDPLLVEGVDAWGNIVFSGYGTDH